MCGRFNYTDEQLDEIKQIINEANERAFGKKVKTGEVFPTNLAAVLAWEDSKISPVPIKWGFPKWKGKGVVINARAETAAQKPMFKKSLQTRRCVIPCTGFYEWRHVDGGKKKDKYHLNEPGKNVLYMAGIVDSFTKDDSGTYDAFTILTTAANESVAPLHDRMPVILQADELEMWLRDGVFMQAVLDRVCPALTMALVDATAEEYVQTSLF